MQYWFIYGKQKSCSVGFNVNQKRGLRGLWADDFRLCNFGKQAYDMWVCLCERERESLWLYLLCIWACVNLE